MRFYFNLHDFYKRVDLRCNVNKDVDLPRLYRATPMLDNLYNKNGEDSGLWLLEKRKFVKGTYEYDPEFKSLEDAQYELTQQFYEAVADQMYNL